MSRRPRSRKRPWSRRCRRERGGGDARTGAAGERGGGDARADCERACLPARGAPDRQGTAALRGCKGAPRAGCSVAREALGGRDRRRYARLLTAGRAAVRRTIVTSPTHHVPPHDVRNGSDAVPPCASAVRAAPRDGDALVIAAMAEPPPVARGPRRCEAGRRPGRDARHCEHRAERVAPRGRGWPRAAHGGGTDARAAPAKHDRVHPSAVLHEDARRRQEGEEPLLRVPHEVRGAELRRRRGPAGRPEAAGAGREEPLDEPRLAAGGARAGDERRRGAPLRPAGQLLRRGRAHHARARAREAAARLGRQRQRTLGRLRPGRRVRVRRPWV